MAVSSTSASFTAHLFTTRQPSTSHLMMTSSSQQASGMKMGLANGLLNKKKKGKKNKGSNKNVKSSLRIDGLGNNTDANL
jgi:hypothetical protein